MKDMIENVKKLMRMRNSCHEIVFAQNSGCYSKLTGSCSDIEVKHMFLFLHFNN